MDAVVLAVALYRVAGSLLVLRWPFWGGVTAVACDLFDLLLFDIARTWLGWAGFADVAAYQLFDKWLDQVYLGAFLLVALQDFAPRPRMMAAALWLIRFAAFAAFEAGFAGREALLVAPNVFEFWFLAVAFAMRYRPGLAWTPARTAAVLGGLLVAKLVQEWALHVGRLFDAMTFLGALDAIWRTVTGR
jgi:hypothetical protein